MNCSPWATMKLFITKIKDQSMRCHSFMKSNYRMRKTGHYYEPTPVASETSGAKHHPSFSQNPEPGYVGPGAGGLDYSRNLPGGDSMNGYNRRIGSGGGRGRDRPDDRQRNRISVIEAFAEPEENGGENNEVAEVTMGDEQQQQQQNQNGQHPSSDIYVDGFYFDPHHQGSSAF